MAQRVATSPLEIWGEYVKEERIETGGNGLYKGMDPLSDKNLRELTKKPEEIEEMGKIPPEVLYKELWINEDVKTSNKILEVRTIIHEAIDYLSMALDIDDEIERESVMNLFAESIFKLSIFIKVNKNLKDAICLIQTAVEGQIKSVYERDKILALKEVLTLIKDNIFMDEETLDKCFDILESAGFDINAPLAEVELAL